MAHDAPGDRRRRFDAPRGSLPVDALPPDAASQPLEDVQAPDPERAADDPDPQRSPNSSCGRTPTATPSHRSARAEPTAPGNDTGRLDVHGPGGTAAGAVKLFFDASRRIGSARWHPRETAAALQQDWTRSNR